MGLVNFLNRDILPLRWLNLGFVPASALAGGWVFASTGHWVTAVQVCLFYLGLFWMVTWPACWIAGLICRILGMANPPVQY